jgi:hypothetical protein
MHQPDVRLPDFIIPGAMKSGTSSMHGLLADHPDVYIPDDELFFFSIGDFDEHSDHYFRADGEWLYPDWEGNFDEHLEWYRSYYKDADPSLTWGEDSTSYLTSRKAPERIADVNPDVKFVVLLRDPVDRTYSHYWHELRKGYVFNSFETAIERTPGTLLKRSMYARGLKRFFRHFDRDRFKFVFFQDFIERQQKVIDEVCAFLDLDPVIDVDNEERRENVGAAPLSITARRMENYFFRRHIDRPSISNTTDWIADMDPPNWLTTHLKRGPKGWLSLLVRNLKTRDFRHNFLLRDYPAMNDETREFLEHFFVRENEGLSELVGQDVSEYWPYFSS